jgi:HPt (histidine-containing phosphotransfer) domain-containing protein
MYDFQFINFDYLDELIGEDIETKQVILITLLEEVPAELRLLNETMVTKDWKNFHEVSHKLKSTLAYIGNDAIFEANQHMMMASRNMENMEKIPHWFDEVETLWGKIEPEIQIALDNL